MKRIHTTTLGDKVAKVYRDSEFNEYRVRLYIQGKLNEPADYFTGDKDDAIDTAFAMVRHATRRANPLSVAFNVAIMHITSKVLPCGFDVSAKAPKDYLSLMAHYVKTGRIAVWNGASDKTIFDDSEVNYAFRAWHDSKHVTGKLPFTKAGECGALKRQKADVRALYDGETADYFCRLLEAEIYGQFCYQEKHGGFPVDQIGFARAYLDNHAAALLGDFGVSTAA